MNSVIEKLAEVETEKTGEDKRKVAAGSREGPGPGTEEEPDCN